ncbi:MAG: acyl-CoA dehydrogenase [SAR202 cluster bacterium]|nr:acyl-CoA dehydrogenase [Chloroflexota bacterium]MDP6419778.1 acyl-CoA dehydrogenase family protein [SAR202 cluster bacterium]HAL47703.1 acyl-CoA dehydrogenase [Dehalococcoidia bacterium]MDP6665710.1 acyl-CoA dehydrogenase family protein [SAR202 cluster bacterium]MDP6798365.1 acyl-CoA dehydrogenase family protein [SAR202 cluster bacterium]
MDDQLLSEDELLLKNTIKDFADNTIAPRAAHHDETGEFPWENMRGLAEMGLFGLGIDEEYGGSGGTNRQVAIVVEEIARACAATATTYGAHLFLCLHFIQMYGTDGQKRQFIPPLVKGETIGAFALTEPDSGSDAAAMHTTATGSDGSYLLNGSKTFITNADEADVLIVMASVDRSLRARGIIALIVEKDSTGLSINPLHGKMGIRASSTAEVVFDNCAVPMENRLGDEGAGFREAMEVLNGSRLTIAAQSVGIAQAAYDSALAYVQQRRAFGQRLADFQGLQWMLVDMATSIETARLLTHKAATLRDNGLPYITTASMAKLHASKVAVECADKAVQMHGGIGYFAPTDAERFYRDAKVMEIYEGASEVQRLIIARNIIPREESGN